MSDTRVRARFERDEPESRNCKALVRPDVSAEVRLLRWRRYCRASSAAVCFSFDVVRVVMDGWTVNVASRLRCCVGGTYAGLAVPLPAVTALDRSGIACEKSCSSRQTVQWSSNRAGSGCTSRYDGAGLRESNCDDVGALLGISGWPIVWESSVRDGSEH